MSHKHSACIPPPQEYSQKARPSQTPKYRDRGGGRGRGRGGRGGGACYNRHANVASARFQDDQSEPVEEPSKDQPRDRFYRNEDDDYFARIGDEEQEEGTADNETASEKNSDSMHDKDDDDDDDDPLDAYMRSLEGDPKTEKSEESKSPSQARDSSQEHACSEYQEMLQSTSCVQESTKKAIRLDIDETDDIEESYYQFVEQRKSLSNDSADDLDEKQDLVEYDKDGNVLSVRKIKREVEPLPPVDHSKIEYAKFEKMFYREHDEIKKLTSDQSDDLRAKLEIKVSGDSPPKPVCSFAHFKFDEQLMRVIRRSEYTQPTPIQAQSIPAALSGRNIIGIAVTGSGKTAAYVWPMIVHIMGQPDLKRGDGPIGLVLVPTRELALQVYGEAKKFASSYKIAVVCAYGGGSKYEQSKDLEAGAEIVVATPGRLIDLIKMGVTNLKRVTYLVLDEADRFFEMGFEAQVRSICDHIRPDRQTLLFSATFKYKIEQLARTVAENPIKIVQRSLGEANEDVTQHVMVLPNPAKKWDWLTNQLVELMSAGSIIIFVTRIMNSEELQKNLREFGQDTLLLHGDMEQSERNRVITSFKRKEKDIMIATDVAARGLDISHIKTVINYDVARDIDTHIHRVGRTGRAGSKGDAYTLLTEKDKEFAGYLVKNLESSNQKVGQDLLNLAMQSHNFRRTRQKHPGGHRSSTSSDSHKHRYNHQHNKFGHNRDHGQNRYEQHRHNNHSFRDQNHYHQRERDSNQQLKNDYDRKRPRWG